MAPGEIVRNRISGRLGIVISTKKYIDAQGEALFFLVRVRWADEEIPVFDSADNVEIFDEAG